MSTWIKCTDKMPDSKKLVLVWVREEIRDSEFYTSRKIGFYTKGGDVDFDDGNCCADDCQDCENDTTHFLTEGWYQEIDEHATCDGCYDVLLNVVAWLPLPECKL